MTWVQRTVRLHPVARGIHLITGAVIEALPELRDCRVGVLHVFIQHTSASLAINENADPEVRSDLERALNAIVPEDFSFEHTTEGPDDMPAHVKSALIGTSVTVPVTAGALALGTWQGVYLCEHRDRGGSRSLVLTLEGDFAR
jgi:secondary thiamine-phosphate synthase enzyme